MANAAQKKKAVRREDIESLLREGRTFAPPATFGAQSVLGDMVEVEAIRKAAARHPEAWWSQVAREDVRWMRPFTRGLDRSNAPFYTWFDDGALNLSDNCLDRHCETWRANKAAIIWEGEPTAPGGPEIRTLTYAQLRYEVNRLCQALYEVGVGKGDRVAFYMPMVPEAAVAMLACARIGAVHSIVFAGFSAESLRDRIIDAECKCVITADGGWRRGKILPLKDVVDKACEGVASVEAVIVLKRTGNEVAWTEGRDHWYHDVIDDKSGEFDAVPLAAEHPLFILYTSGTTGKPKGIVHTTGGYTAYVTRTTRWVFDLQDSDVFWCTADIGWITGHSYVVYGVLSNGGTTLMYEGAPNEPALDRLWDIIERHKVSIFYTAPTAIRTFIRWGDEHVDKHDLSSLRLLGSVGEPINPAAWVWYHEKIGGGRCPIVDTWWQTETGGIMISPLPGVQTCVPGSATRPLPGIIADIVDHEGVSQPDNAGGLLVIRHPWPGMARGIWNDPERFDTTYWQKIEGCYFPGDGARRDDRGNFWIMGRVDDVVNVSGHRLGTMEVESALVSHDSVAESAVVARPDDITGQAIVAFVTPQKGIEAGTELAATQREHVATEIGKLAMPAEIRFAAALPKTRSGKIMRRLLRELATDGQVTGDTTTLEDFSVIEKLRQDG